PDDLQLLLQVLQLCLQIYPALLYLHRSGVVGEDEHENHRPETAADTVQKRQTENFDTATPAHGFRASPSRVSGWCRWSGARDSRNGARPADRLAWAAGWSQPAHPRAVVRRPHRTVACALRNSHTCAAPPSFPVWAGHP